MASNHYFLVVLTIISITLQCSSAALLQRSWPLQIPTLPVNGGPTELANTTLALAYVAIGRGVQNYTCSEIGTTPVLIGAIANLYDGTTIARFNPELLHSLPSKVVYKPTPELKTPLCGLRYLGHHFFDLASTPIFNLTSAADVRISILFGIKLAGVKAPAVADIGPAKTGAVDWLLIDEKKTNGYEGKSVGLKQVYRVITAGGGGGTCTTVGIKSVEYATEYWFYK